MTVFNTYSTGTAGVVNGSTTITGAGTLWSGINARPGDDIELDGHTVIILDVLSTTQLQISPWPYASVPVSASPASPYKIIQRSPLRFAGGQAMADVDTLIASLSNPVFSGTVTAAIIAGGSAASSSLVLESTSATGTTDAIIFKTAAQVERARFISNGNFGIGITLPTEPLHVVGNALVTGITKTPTVAGGTAASSSLILESTTGAGTTDLISMKTGSQLERLRIDTNGCLIVNKTGTAFAAPNATHPMAIIGSTADCVLGFWAWGSANAPGTISMNYTPSNTSHLTQSATQDGFWLGLIGANGSTGVDFAEGARIIFVADGNFSAGSSPGRLIFATVPSGSVSWLERMRIDKDGRVNIGNQAAGVDAFMLQISDPNATGGISIITNAGAFSGSSYLSFDKSRSSSSSGVAAVVSGDNLGYIQFRGANGTNRQQAAYILAQSDGTPSSTSMPGRILIATTPSGSNTPVERMRISNGGNTYMTGATAQTTGSAANAVLNNASTPAGELLRSTSSLRYKKDIEPIDAARLAAVLAINPFWYRSRANGDNPDWSFYGCGAEDVAKIDPRLVFWGYRDEDRDEHSMLKKGAMLVPDGVMYDRLAILQIAALKARIEKLESLQPGGLQ